MMSGDFYTDPLPRFRGTRRNDNRVIVLGPLGIEVRCTPGSLATLGKAGWEMIGSGPAYGHMSSDPVLHFKRRDP